MDSIIRDYKNGYKECFACYRMGDLHRHHVLHGTANRRLSEREGLWVYLCPACHEKVHKNRAMDLWLIQVAERAWLEKNGKEKEDFIRVFGKNYL